MWMILSFAASTVLAILAYAQARNFVTRRLRYVDAVQSTIAPFIAGIGAAVISLPVVSLLGVIPIIGSIVGFGTALTLGLAVGTGVAAGVRDIRNKLPGY
ncbi:MAG: hypothetical protein JWM95_853 [Gemmatimonadetes bacterium]|nr:hypothetical protein [Gemmatimonadota bacterium]